MYKIIFYKDKNGKSEVKDFIESVYKSEDKNNRINFKKIQDYLKSLQIHGLKLNNLYIKHCYFIKKTQKTPPKEIEKAQKRFKDFLERNDEYE